MAQSPFIPFIILFCHIIETSEASDLEHMGGLVETLESASDTHGHNTCDRQRRLFKALYDVAAKYIEVKSRAGGGGMSWAMAQQQYADSFASTTATGLGLGTTLDPGGMVGGPVTTTTTAGATLPGHVPSQGEADGDAMGLAGGLGGPVAMQNTAFGDVDMEMDLSGAQLWDWFNKNQSIMRMLEDT